jgi:hypothetical protein
MITADQLSQIEALETAAFGTTVESNVLPPTENSKQRTPVSFTDGRGNRLKGHITGINLCIQLEDGTHAWAHPSKLRTTDSEYNSAHHTLAL